MQRGDGRASRRKHAIEYPPWAEPRRPVSMDEMPVRDLARKPRPVDQRTLWPARASSIAVDAPAQRAPITIASYTRTGRVYACRPRPSLRGAMLPGSGSFAPANRTTSNAPHSAGTRADAALRHSAAARCSIQPTCSSPLTGRGDHPRRRQRAAPNPAVRKQTGEPAGTKTEPSDRHGCGQPILLLAVCGRPKQEWSDARATKQEPRLSAAEFSFGPIASSRAASTRSDARVGSAPARVFGLVT